MTDYSAALRAALVASGRSQYDLARETGVSQSLISRLLAGGSINWENGCRLAAAVGYKLKKAKCESKG
jgi:transcriptional regulator with XRE-family HTH domain